MQKNNCQTKVLGKGEMNVYDFGGAKLHAYKTNDLLSDEVFILEKNGEAVIIEGPCFTDNIQELTAYLEGLKVKVVGKLLAYHMAGAAFLPDIAVYATQNADEYGHTGGGKALIDNFAGAFGTSFDASIPAVTHTIEEGTLSLAGIQMNIVPTAEAFDIEIPEINTVYTHMLGHDCHSIVAGSGHADAIIAQMEGYVQRGYDLILTSHYTPEDLKDAATKVAYLTDLKAIAAGCTDAAGFKQAVHHKYPAYAGENYLDMTAGFFFPDK